MAVSVRCRCGKSFRVPDDQWGQEFRCPACRAIVSTSAFVPTEQPTAFEVPESSKPKRPPHAWRYTLSFFSAMLSAVLLMWLFRERTDWERIAHETSPGFMMAAFEMRHRSPDFHERVETYEFMLRQSEDLFEENASGVVHTLVEHCALLNEEGYPTDIFMVLSHANEIVGKARDRAGFAWKKTTFFHYMDLYEFYRREFKTDSKAAEMLDSRHKFG